MIWLINGFRNSGKRLEKPYGNPTPLEIEGTTLPPGGVNLPELRPAQLPAPPGLSSLRCPSGAGRGLRSPVNPDFESRIRYRFIERTIG
jgi:hypothetical protein